jgi:hypothetical protein
VRLTIKGSFFRSRYITQTANIGYNPVAGLPADAYEDIPMAIQTEESTYSQISALAFMGGFYPAVKTNGSSTLDQSSILANGNVLDFPDGGYQYPIVYSPGAFDPESVWVDGNDGCIQGEVSRDLYANSPDYLTMQAESLPLYTQIGPSFLTTWLDPSLWNYGSAYGIFDMMDYQNRHDSVTSKKLNETYPGVLGQLAFYASHKVWHEYGDLTVYANTPGDDILAMAGKTLASRVLQMLQSNYDSAGVVNKFTLLVSEFPPILSLISLLGLPSVNSDFYNLPPFASSLVFELFSNDANDNPAGIDDSTQLYVRVLFRNSSDPYSVATTTIQEYPVLGNGPDQTDMTWDQFVQAIGAVALDSVPNWCNICSGDTLFCAAFDAANSTGSGSGSSHHRLTRIVAAVIGAAIGIVLVVVLLGFVALCGCLSLSCRKPRRGARGASGGASGLGGFKGSSKLASDVDLNIPRNAAPVGLSDDAETFGAVAAATGEAKGGERVGSWELKTPRGADGNEFDHDEVVDIEDVFVGDDKPSAGRGGHARFASLGSTVVGRPSFEADEGERDLHSGPVNPRESV